jgi:hypothetical protein
MIVVGQKYNRLVVLERRGSNRHKNSLWLCRCECGTETVVEGYRINKGIIKSCGCLQREAAAAAARKTVHNLLGLKIGRLLIIQRVSTSLQGNATWLCLCDCGNTTIANANHLSKRAKLSCGCIRSEMAALKGKATATHGQTGTRQYRNFLWMKRRARKLRATPRWADLGKIRQIYQDCPTGFHVDHVVPLKGKIVSGLHVETNLQYLPQAVNAAKSNRFEPSFETRSDLDKMKGF